MDNSYYLDKKKCGQHRDENYWTVPTRLDVDIDSNILQAYKAIAIKYNTHVNNVVRLVLQSYLTDINDLDFLLSMNLWYGIGYIVPFFMYLRYILSTC